MRTRPGLVTTLLLLAACADTGGPVGATPGRPSFDGESALGLVRTQVDFGPRVPGTEGHERQLTWMLDRLDSLAPEMQAELWRYSPHLACLVVSMSIAVR